MEEMKKLEKRVADLEDFVERIAISLGKLTLSLTQPKKSAPYNPVENTK